MSEPMSLGDLIRAFEAMQEDLGSSNSGSEELLNAPLVIKTSEA